MLQIIGKCLRHGPLLPQQFLARQVFHYLFADEIRQRELGFMQGRWLGIEIPELDLHCAFSLDGHMQLLLRYQQKPDALIRVHLDAALALLKSEKDPDTLFFQRRLVISGNTDLAHHVKNTLDNKLWPAPPEFIQKAQGLFAKHLHPQH